MKKTYEQMLNELHERQIALLNERIFKLEQLENKSKVASTKKLFNTMKRDLQYQLLKLYRTI